MLNFCYMKPFIDSKCRICLNYFNNINLRHSTIIRNYDTIYLINSKYFIFLQYLIQIISYEYSSRSVCKTFPQLYDLCIQQCCHENCYIVFLGIPRFTIEPQSAVSRTGSTVTLTCAVAQTDPAATIKWTFNGAALQAPPPPPTSGGGGGGGGGKPRRTYDIREGYLRVASFGASQEGIYQCVATNPLGTVVSAEARLDVAC